MAIENTNTVTDGCYGCLFLHEKSKQCFHNPTHGFCSEEHKDVLTLDPYVAKLSEIVDKEIENMDIVANNNSSRICYIILTIENYVFGDENEYLRFTYDEKVRHYTTGVAQRRKGLGLKEFIHTFGYCDYPGQEFSEEGWVKI